MTKRTVVRKPTRNSGSKSIEDPEQQLSRLNKEEGLWQQLYIISERWQCDLLFFRDELNFFRKLIDKYFIWLIDEQNVERARQLLSQLLKLDKKRFTILQRLDQHRRNLKASVGNPFSVIGKKAKDEHAELEVLIATFVKDFVQTKKEVFKITENIIDSERIKRLFNGG